jgi:hypothetical protein
VSTQQGEEFGELRDRMTRVEVKLDLVLGQLGGAHTDHEARLRELEHRPDPSAHLTEHATRLADHESRLRKLERAVWMWAGAAACGGGGVGAFLASVLT